MPFLLKMRKKSEQKMVNINRQCVPRYAIQNAYADINAKILCEDCYRSFQTISTIPRQMWFVYHFPRTIRSRMKYQFWIP
jgi:hypothetical protein